MGYNTPKKCRFPRAMVALLAASVVVLSMLSPAAPPVGKAEKAGAVWFGAPSNASAADAAKSAALRWDATVQAAKSEGKVTLLGPETASVRPALVEAFRKAYPEIELEYQAGSIGSLATRLRAEIAQKKTSFDVVIGGTAVLRNKDILDPLPSRLILADATDGKLWRSSEGSGLKWIDHEKQFAAQTSEWVFGYIVINARSVNPGSLKSWSDLLKPEWKGQIASHDPRGAGAGQEVASYLVEKLGGKYIVDLFKGQDVALTRSYSQVADWVSQGKYQIGIAQVPDRIEALKKEGVALRAFSLADAPGTLTGGFSVLSILKSAPHSNAATVFINWVLSKAGQEALHRPQLYPSSRSDVGRDHVPDYTLPAAGLNYLDTYTEEFQATRVKLAKQVAELIGR